MATWSEFAGLGQSASHVPLSSSPPTRVQASPQYIASYPTVGPALPEPPSAMRNGAPLDPGGNRPNLPVLHSGGGSSPPPAKFREVRGQGASPALPVTHSSPALPEALGGQLHYLTTWNGTPMSTEGAAMGVETGATANAMWNAAAHQAFPQSEFAIGGSGSSTPHRGASPAVPNEQEPGHTELPLRLVALQQLKGAAEGAPVPSRRPVSRQRSAPALRSTAGGAHAAAGSPSPERERISARGQERGRLAEERPAGPGKLLAGPPEDKYFKILQNLQAKGAVGVRGKLLEGRDRRENRVQALGDSAALSRPESSKPWTPVSRSSPATVPRPSRHRRLAADSESDDSIEE